MVSSKFNVKEVLSNPTAERSVISILLKNPDTMMMCCSENLFYEDFAVEANKIIYSVISYLVEEGTKKLDTNTIFSTVKDPRSITELEEIGGREYLDTLFISTVIEDNLSSVRRRYRSVDFTPE